MASWGRWKPSVQSTGRSPTARLPPPRCWTKSGSTVVRAAKLRPKAKTAPSSTLSTKLRRTGSLGCSPAIPPFMRSIACGSGSPRTVCHQRERPPFGPSLRSGAERWASIARSLRTVDPHLPGGEADGGGGSLPARRPREGGLPELLLGLTVERHGNGHGRPDGLRLQVLEDHHPLAGLGREHVHPHASALHLGPRAQAGQLDEAREE